MNIVPDFGALAEELISRNIENLKPKKILISETLFCYIEKLAQENHTQASIALEEIERLNSIKKKLGFELDFIGKTPGNVELKNMERHETDRAVRNLAFDEGETLYTISEMQARTSRAKGINVRFETKISEKEELRIESFFDEETMSVHLKEDVCPYAKKGGPGGWEFKKLSNEELSQKELQEIAREIVEEAGLKKTGFIEIERFGSTIIQLDKLRIVITKPPFADAWEVTAVRPVKRLGLSDYSLRDNLKRRLEEKAEGILISGSPGMGKTTFAAALAEFYAENEKIVKTVEAPRDLVLPDKITQYSLSHGTNQEIHDILLLSRPDYTIFDEVRNTEDFMLFSDLRLSGIGFIGVVHATAAIDSIQRFLGRIDLGVIPQVIDTVVFIKDGGVSKVLGLEMTVKVPAGMTESDLARPVVNVRDFETGQPEYEIYTYGEQTVVLPVCPEEAEKEKPVERLARQEIERELRKYHVKKVEILSENKCRIYVPEDKISNIIGKQGSKIQELEKNLGMGIDVCSSENIETSIEETIPFNVKITSKSIVFEVDPEHINKQAKVLVDGDYLLSAQVSKKSMIKIKKSNKLGKIIADSINDGSDVKLLLE